MATLCSDTIPFREETITLRLPGATRPVTLMHITDIHFCECDERDADMLALMRQRTIRFHGAPQMLFYRLLDHCYETKCDFIALTGDLYDTITQANLDYLEATLRRIKLPWGMIWGDHEWYGLKNETREQIVARLGHFVQHRTWLHTRDLAGVTLMFVDDTRFAITPEQLAEARRVLDASKSCLVFLHIPMNLPTLREPTIAQWNHCATLSDPDHINPEHRETTHAFERLLSEHPKVGGVFAGHLHLFHDDPLTNGARQYVSGPSFEHCCRRVQIVPAD